VRRNLAWSKKVLYFISSRPSESIWEHIEEFPESSYRLLATEDNYAPIIHDVTRYVDNVVIPKLKKHRGYADDDGEKVRKHLLSKPACMFLYVKLLFQTLLRTEVARLEETLAETPFGIHEFYRHILDKIDPATRARQSELLLCLLYSFRPLDLEELDFARSQRKFRRLLMMRGHTNKGNLEALKKDLRLLSPLIVYRESDGIVEFCHHSAKEHLTHEANSPRPSYNPFLATKHDAHTYMAISCLKLLTQTTHLPYPTRHDSGWTLKLDTLRREYFMIIYALDYWHDHCLEAFRGPGGELENSELLELLSLLDNLRQAPGSNRFWSTVMWRAGSNFRLGHHLLGYSIRTVERLREMTSVEFFSALGIPHLLRLAIENNQQKEPQALIRRGSRHSEALKLAISTGNVGTVDIVLKYLNLSSLDGTAYRGAIICAANINEPPLFKRLLSLRPRLDVIEIAGSLYEAYINNNEEILQSLLVRVQVVHSALIGSLRDECGMTVIHWLCAFCFSSEPEDFSSKNLDVVETVMHLGGDINAQDVVGNTPLHYYCMRPGVSSDLVTGLVALGANPALQNNAGWLPCHLAARRAREVKTLKALASTDSSSIRRKTLGGFTALHWAALRQDLYVTEEDADIIGYLLQQGLDPFARTKKGKTPLEIAATDGSIDGFQWATAKFDGIQVTIVFGIEDRRTPAETTHHAIEEVSEGDDDDKYGRLIEGSGDREDRYRGKIEWPWNREDRFEHTIGGSGDREDGYEHAIEGVPDNEDSYLDGYLDGYLSDED
jgi:Ankyrin repeat